MTIVNEVITEATEQELHRYYLDMKIDEMVDFKRFLRIMKQSGCKIIKTEDGNKNESK